MQLISIACGQNLTLITCKDLFYQWEDNIVFFLLYIHGCCSVWKIKDIEGVSNGGQILHLDNERSCIRSLWKRKTHVTSVNNLM